MKKRILSILLAVMMVVPMLTMAIPVSAAGELPNNYSYKFEEQDVRNAASGQVFDLEAKGEAVNAPVIDGVISSGEYSVSGNIPRNTTQNGESLANLPFSFAVKGGYLYVAFAYEGEDTQKDIQFDIGVLQDERTDGAFSRKQVTWKRDNTLGNHGWLLRQPGTNSWVDWDTAMDSSKFIVEKSWKSGVYEAKFDLKPLYMLFANSPRGEGIYETPCVSIAIFYNVSNTIGDHDKNSETPEAYLYPDEVGQSHYAFKVGSLKINSDTTVGWVPATVIISDESLAVIAQDKRAISATVGGDYANGVAGQLMNNGRVYSDVLPVVDGTINPGEYSASQTYTGSSYSTDGKINMSYSVGRNGLVYVGISYQAPAHTNMLVQAGLLVNNGAVMQSRGGVTLTTAGGRTNQNGLYKNPLDRLKDNGDGQWQDMWGGYMSDTTWCRTDTSAATSYVGGVITYEVTFSIPKLIYNLEEAGWSAYNATGMFFYMWQNGSSAQYKISRPAATETALQTKFGVNMNLGYFVPTLALPTDIYERFKIETYEEVEDYFATEGLLRSDVAPSVVKLDGVIGAGEYTATQSWDKTTARATDGQFLPGIGYDISGKNYFAYDADYLYVGAEVYDPNYDSGNSKFQLNIGYIDDTVPFDIGHTVRRMNVMATMSDSGVTVGTYGGVLRTQACNSSVLDPNIEDDPATDTNEAAYVGQSAWLAGFNTKSPEIAGSYNADTKTITYEFKVKIADLKAAYGVVDIDRLYITTLAVYTNKDTDETGQHAWNFFKDTTDRVMDILAITTSKNNGGKLVYDANMMGHIINLNRDFATRDSASARISTSAAGLRFKTHYTNEYLAEMAAYAEAQGEEMVVGTLIAPEDYITDEFTHAALGSGRYVEVIANVATPYSNENGVTTIAGSLVNIKDANLDRDFAGIGFIKIGDEYFYSDTYAVKNVSAVATDALADTKAAANDEYKYEVSAGVYSPYTVGQRTILDKLIKK